MVTKNFNFRIDESEVQTVKDFLNYIKETFNVDTKGKQLMKIISLCQNAIDNISSTEYDVKYAYEIELEKNCNYGLLQKLVDKRDGTLKYFCLRDKKPLLIADGKDESSIRKYCDACKTRDLILMERDLGKKAIEMIQTFGNEKIKVEIFACTNPSNDYVQVILGRGVFYCPKYEGIENVSKRCIPEDCNYLDKDIKEIFVSDIEAYKKIKKELEHKGA